MDTWEHLRANSSLPEGFDAYENLLAQQGGGVIITDAMEVEVTCAEFDVEIEDNYEIELAVVEFDVEVEEELYDIEVCDG